jgi:hypothetical protein
VLRKLAFALFALAVSGPARANVAAREMPGSPAGNVGVPHGTAIAVSRETLELRCAEPDGEPVCAFVASYFLENPDTRPAAALAAFWGKADNVELEIAGRSGRILTDDELTTITRDFSAIEAPPAGLEQPHRVGIELALAPRERAVLVARGTLQMGWAGGRGYELEPVYARHHLVQPSAPRSTFVTASYFLAPIRSFRSAGPIDLVIRVPSHWNVALTLATRNGGLAAVPLSDDGTARIASADANTLHLAFERSRGLHPGGPLFGIGGAFGESGGFRLRGGWEIAAPSWLFWSVTAETDASELFAVTPLLEAATDQILIIPSLGFGLGVPIRIEPETAVGARAQATLGVYKLGVVGSLDWFPEARSGASETIVSLLAYVWL